MNDNTIIQFFGIRRSYGFSQQQFIALIKNNLLDNANVAYSHAKVKVLSDDEKTVSALIVTLLHENTYTSEVVKIVLNSQSQGVAKVIRDYIEPDSEDEFYDITNNNLRLNGSETTSKKIVFSTPCDHIPSAVSAVRFLANLARESGYEVTELIGLNANVSNYKNLLKAGYAGFTNIGHGSTSSISLYDGNLNASWFAQQNFHGKCVMYFNSCQVFNDPLLASVKNAKPRTYIGGVKNLPIGPSEECCKAFWQAVIPANSTEAMQAALEAAEQQFIPDTMGFWGDSGVFNSSESIDNISEKQHEEALV